MKRRAIAKEAVEAASTSKKTTTTTTMSEDADLYDFVVEQPQRERRRSGKKRLDAGEPARPRKGSFHVEVTSSRW